MTGKQCALSAMQLRKTGRIPKWIGVPRHPEFLRRLTGIDPYDSTRTATIRAIEALELDVSDYYESMQPSLLAGPETRRVENETLSAFYSVGIGGADGGSVWKDHSRRFEDVEDVLNYDVAQHPLNRTVEQFESQLSQSLARVKVHRRALGDRAWVPDPVDWYNTVFMWGVTTFGWHAFLTAAGLEPERYARLLSLFVGITLRYFTAASRLKGIMLAQSHDDLCASRGPVFSPAWYRQYVFPQYPRVLAPIKAKGAKVIYRGDGNISAIVADLAAAGFDGFFVRSESDLGEIAARYGQSRIILGNISTKVVTFGGKTEIEAEVKRCVRQAGHCPGYFLHISGELPFNVPTDNLFYLFEALKQYSRR